MCQESLARSEVRENRASKPPTDAAANTRAAIATSTADSNSMVSPRGRVQICGKNGCQWMNACVCEKIACSLCSRNFQNVKLRLDFVEIWSIYRHSTFPWNQILVNSNGPKTLFMAILELLNFDCSNFLQFFKSQIVKIQILETLKDLKKLIILLKMPY